MFLGVHPFRKNSKLRIDCVFTFENSCVRVSIVQEQEEMRSDFFQKGKEL